ncbi:cobyrinate a,c-diamide synthase [Candidatus Poribacteria bacterium]|nr:cobyrinate a,c-diamide synthase [Candidatus Poribacteria bacterium]
MNNRLHIPRIVIAGTHSGCGKTTTAIGLMSALSRKNYKVQGFKAGPDYIDPSHHTHVTGIPSRNLDTWMIERDKLLELFEHNARTADISIIEGVMGMFDGYDALDERGSTAHLAKLLGSPVILVINAGAMARSAAAMVHGYKTFDPNVRVVGVIANNIANENHFNYVKPAIEEYTQTPALGYLQRDPAISIDERHLGLIPHAEGKVNEERYEKLTQNVLEHIHLERLIELASDVQALPKYTPSVFTVKSTPNSKIRIGVARDQAFNFYYEDNLDILRALGAELTFFSPVNDSSLPGNLDLLYIGGGFPELFAEHLADNHEMRKSIKDFVDTSMPIYAECGGLMYLAQSIQTFDGKIYPMVGILPVRSEMVSKRLSLGYITINVRRDNLLSNAGEVHRGHEFHWSTIEETGEVKYAYETVKHRRRETKPDGIMVGNVLASYAHLHFASNLSLAENLLHMYSF